MTWDRRSWNLTAIFVVAICIAIDIVQSEVVKDPTLCARTRCKVATSRKFKYEENVWYWYRYSVDVSTNLGKDNSTGDPLNESTLRLDADLVIWFSSPCEGSLRFHNTSISHDPRKYNPEFPDRAGADFKTHLERYTLRFAFDDGRVDELCPDKREPIWALNLKRGVLSMLQNTMHRLDVDHRGDELDVNGVCETSYRLREAKRTSLILRKSKHLSDCVYGSKHFSVVRSNVYTSPRSRTRRSQHPLLDSRSDCELTVDRNVYEKIVCKEEHRLQPLSSGNTGARTESTSVLRLIRKSQDDYSLEYEGTDEEESDKYGQGLDRTKKTNLLYDYARTAKTVHGELRTSRDLLKTMCRLGVSTNELQQRFSETFTAFVHSARLLDYPSLSQLFVRANSICKTGKKHIVDALPFMGSNAAVNVMRDLIIKRYVDQATIDKWVTAFALIPRPNQDTIRTLSPLLDFQHQIPEAQFILSYSATIYAFCSNHETRCDNVEQVTRFLSYLEQRIEKGCAARTHSISTIKETLEALKAIGNMGLETDSLSKRLQECIEDVGGFLPMEVRMASIDAHRRMPSCEKSRDLYFLNYYRNNSLDTEIRIASYLQVMRCPDYNVVKTIKHALKVEEINQVGTFIWSHLTNLYNSASPTKIEIQSLLTDRDLDGKFNRDRRKFSRNYDGSFFSEEYNFGGNYQGNLIFSTKSYIPRTATFNLTFDLFGESVNVFEITTRLEGMEYYAEKFFGPDGPYNNEKMSGFFKTFLRSFRAAPEEDDNYWKRVKRLPDVIDNNFNDPRISLGYKIFGNDLKYSMLNGDREIREALTRLNPWEKFKEITSGKEIQYENALMFLDSTYVVPMTSGLPVRLDFAGSAACDFKMSGLLDAKRITSGEIELVSNIAPSMSVDAIGSMTVDAFYKTAGTKLRTNVYSSGAVQIHLDVKGMRSIRLSLGLPNKKMEVFSIGTDILLTKGNGAEVEEKPIGVLITGQNSNDRRLMQSSIPPGSIISNTSCTWGALDRLVGLKLCLDYQLSNVTKDPNAPYFLLSGPTLFKVSMIKADPTAKHYLLEYKWEKTKEENVFRVAFDTPGSQVNRELSATVSFDVKTHNVTVLLRSAGNSIVAEGTYKSTENETFVDIGFDINGTKHLDATFGYAIKKFQYGYTYSPQMHVIVNNERIVALSGTIRSAWKNNVSQCDIDLTFRTKKVWSKLVGYIVRRNVSLAGDFQLEYQLQKMPKKETLQLEVLFSNRSSKTLTHKTADLKLRSTAYPQLNTVIIAWYQQALGHLELHAEVNSSPHLMDDRHKLTAKLILSYSKMYFQNQDTKVSALIAVTKPIQNLDIKVGISHYAMGPETRTSLLIGYAPGKEIVLTVNLIMPRGLTFAMEGHANLTIPNFNAMLVDVRITERSKRTYELDFTGTWFSGHNLTARGTYSDRSVATVVSHSLKLILKSPSFASDVLVNCKLYRNYSDIRIGLYVEQVDRDRYAFILNHTVLSATDFISYVEGRYKGNVYSVMTDVNTEREIRMEIHLDKWRDVHLALIGFNEENRKEFGAEVKWDANRDPALKLAIHFSMDKTVLPAISEEQPPQKNLSAIVTVTYPGRLIAGSCRVAARGYYNYAVDVAIDWNPENTIGLFVATEYYVKAWTRSMSMEGRLVTPFENWKKTALSAKYLQEENAIKVSGSAHWKDSQRLIAEFDGSTKQREKIREWKVNCGITSSVHSISSVIVNVTHRLIDSQLADTRLLVKYNPDKVIDAWSIWYLNKESDNVFNLTGNLHLESPVTSYRKSDMRCQLQILPDWKFLGAANLDLDKRTYTGKLIGDIHRFMESMIQFNVTTPLEKFSFVRGRFGLSEKNKHAVAEVVTPNGPMGFEALCQLFTADYDFNVRLSLATPLEVLRRSLLVGKLSNREADFRVAYNNIQAGFQGVWSYHNITDFHYSYLLFTPLRGFEESGIVTKLIVMYTVDGNLDVDTEFSIKLAETKLGVKAKGGPKSPPVNILINPSIEIAKEDSSNERQLKERKEEEEEEVAIEDDFEEQSNLYWHGEVEMYLIILEDIIGELDIDNDGPTYKILGSLKYFQGTIVLDDTFWIQDFFNMKNELTIIVPFQVVNEITCLNSFVVDMEQSSYTMQMHVNVRRNATWYETGMDANYVYSESELDDSQTHRLRINIKTPMEFIRFLDTNTTLDIDENFYKAKIGIRGPNSSIELLGSIESEMSLDTMLVLEIDTPMVKLPKSTFTVKRDFTEKERYLKISGEIAEPVSKSFSLQSEWYVAEDRFRAFVALKSWIETLKSVEVDVSCSNTIATNDTASLNIYSKYLADREYRLLGNYTSETIQAIVYTPFSNDKPHFEFQGKTSKMNDTAYNLDGNLSDLARMETQRISGTIVTRNGSLHIIEMTIGPSSGIDQSDSSFIVKLKKERYGLSLSVVGRAFNGRMDANFINYFNWDARARGEFLNRSNRKEQFQLTSFMSVQVNGNTTLYIHAETPAEDIRNISFTGNMLLTNNSGDVRANGRLNGHTRYGTLQWKLIYMVDMFGRLLVGYEPSSNDLEAKVLDTRMFFRNPGRAFRNIDVGFDLDVDREKWKFAANATLGFRNHENIDGVFVVRLPPPNNDDHRFLISYHANGGVKDASYVIGYNAVKANTNYASDGSIHMGTRDIDGHLRVSWGMLPVQSINNLLNVSFDNKEILLKYSLYTPKFQQQETLVFVFDYDAKHDTVRRLINANIHYPASTHLASANISYESLSNVNGTVDAVLPFANVSQVGCQFVVFTTLQRNKKYAKIFWSKNTAIVDSDYTYRSEKLDSDLEGILHAEVPLNTRHVAHLTYGYKKRPQVTTGHSVLTYNGQKVVHGQYDSKSESRAGFEKDRVQITIENAYKPIGILYVNQYEYSAGNEGTNYPTVEFKHVNLYRLDNRTAFNVAAESRIKTTHTGQNIHLKAIHSNRTVQLKTDYQVLPGEFDQNCWFSLAEDVWISYRVNILNKTTEEVDNQFLVLSVSYPRRNFTLDGSYWISSEEFKSEAKLDWDQDTYRPRTIGALFNWINLSSNADTSVRQRAIFALRHPSFKKQVLLRGELLKESPRDLFNCVLTADYSTDPDKHFALSASLKDESKLPSTRRYVYELTGRHPSTRFDLDVRGFVQKRDNAFFQTVNNGLYKRSFIINDSGQLNARLDLNRDELFFHREYNDAVKHLNIRYQSIERRYFVNGSVVNTPDLNATGVFLLDPAEKFTWMTLNYTPDGIESLQMYGKIPDARNAVFNIWRTYEEDFFVSDVSFYLKLNHSRLITSTLRWRPELKSDIITSVKKTAMDAYDGLNNDADSWKQYIKSETVNIISDVWSDAQEDLEEFLDDWNNLKELQKDLDELKVYLNDSYNANDFYIKDVVALGLYVVDELSLRSHIQSLPNIVNEIWEIMGESGEAIRNSLIWLIETIKNAFNKVSEIVAAILRGDSISQVANIIEKLLEKYDKFVKDLHVSFIKYIENLWVKISQSISQQWHRFLLMIEPLFIRFIHYLETVVWKASKEVLDFLYDRQNDLIASPYFDRFTNFTQDIDKLYRDIKSNDIITNIQKYSGIIIRFLKERYFTFVPFGKELQDIVDEIITELKELQKLPSIHYALEKMQQVYGRVYYVYEYLEVRAKIENALRLIHSKLMEVSQTALEAESRYREAKTKFIFDPNQGLMCFEQKLPMSWHAFNQTPEFHEIPEFRAVSDLKSYFVSSNLTFWSVYRYKPYMDPFNWFPPFKAHAMIVASQHFTTFDGRHLEFAVPCGSSRSYLLARDFVRNTFTVLIEFHAQSDRVTHKIIVLLGKEALEIDYFNDSIKRLSEQSSSLANDLQLPIELENGTTYVYQTESVIIVERKENQLRLECNLKFNLCTLELSGWYHGKTAGILGTMNYEPMDDTTSSNGIVMTDVGKFADSWSIDQDHRCSSNALNSTSKPEQDTTVPLFCNDLYVNKSSEFVSCFDVIEPGEYFEMCIQSARKSEACTIALSYLQACMFHDTYLRIPDACTNCNMLDGSQVAEGQFRRLEGERVPRSTDVVFIVEGKDCNRGVKGNRSIEHLVAQLNKEFRDQGLTDNRWSLVVFGADGVLDHPRSVVIDGQIFTKNTARFLDYFDRVPIGDGSRDIFAAIAFASKLVFRAGVSKTFILMPCSHCEPENQTLDYSVLHEVLLEHGITLHVLMDSDFEFEKERLNKLLYGLDATKAYTKKDARTLVGDVDLRRQVKLPKSALGYCTPLALEINGTIFSGEKLRFDKLASIKKFASVFSKRVALTAQPNPCQNCECTADNNGVTRMECIPCVYPTPISVDYETFNLNDSLASLQPLNMDYGQIDIDDS
ncbi:apolipoprotein lipid transfer particle [Osmia lignaria lignaria]|uniref:apolipoprotein lipid transfer particle n=1 Tax=Osmia lignaria lignaria TaxID=1437193 RepID=UPI00402BCC42